MVYDLIIKINGFNEADSNKLVETVKSFISSLEELDLRKFSNILITKYFQEDIESLTSSKESPFKTKYIINKKAFAKVITIPKDNDFEMYLVIDADFAQSLISDDKQAYNDSIHILHHELVHIYDNNNKIDIFKEDMLNSKYKGVASVIFPIAEICWSEYFANFISCSTAKNSTLPFSVANSLEIDIRQLEFDIKTELMALKLNPSRVDLFNSVCSHIEALLKSASYVLGYMAGLEKNLEELSYDTDYYLEGSYFKDIWEVMKYELTSMHQLYPYNWVNLSIYSNLTLCIEAFFNQMGIVLIEDEEKRLSFKLM